jgi:uncharacterized RDD family membrane protein YckC
MKCPKCGYLGFEEVERCRNCGYDFSLVPTRNTPDIPIRRNESQQAAAFDDLTLIDGAASAGRQAESGTFGGTAEGRAPRSPTGELPLFGDFSVDDDAPLITTPSRPRTPLSVRRATPDVPRLRSGGRMSAPDSAEDPERGQTLSPADRAHRAEWPAERLAHLELEPAALVARGLAAALDLVILAAIDVVVVYFTMQICGLTREDLSILPRAPLIAFLILQNGGYLVAFTAGGQTLGKMAAGIKVVPARSAAPIDLGRSFIRTLVWIALAIPAGLGFLTALIGREHRGLHDRCAGTRVVRATA